MDDRDFDRLSQLLGDPATRRAGLKAALAAVFGAGAAAAEAEARRRKDHGGKDAEDELAARRRRKKCTPECAAGQSCVKGACVCDDGGTACGASCCALGQRCEGGQCMSEPQPDACIAFGEPCKGTGRRCCEGLVCASGPGGLEDIGCYVAKTGRCTSSAECTYGTRCEDGICKGIPQPTPPPDPGGCIPDGGSGCARNADCCTQGSTCVSGTCTAVAPKCDAATCDGLCCSGTCVALENLVFRNVGVIDNTAFPSTFSNPTYVQPSADGLTAYVAGYQKHNVTIWTRPSVGGAWSKAATLGTSSSGSSTNQFNLPYGLAFTADQKTLYVADGNNDRISVWTRPSTANHTGWAPAYQITTTEIPGLNDPQGVWLSPDEQTLAVAAYASNKVYVLKPNSGAVPWQLDATLGSTSGSTPGQLNRPTGVYCNLAAGECFIADTNNNRVAVWKKSSSGWSGTTQADAQFPCVSGTCTGGTAANQFRYYPARGSLSPSGNVYWASDPGNNRITAFRKASGSWSGVSGVVAMPCAGALASGCTCTSGSSGSCSGTGSIYGPEGVYTAVETGELFVADTGNSRVSIWTGCPV